MQYRITPPTVVNPPAIRILPSALDCGKIDRGICIGVKPCVKRAIRVQAGDVVSCDPANYSKQASNKDFAILAEL